MPTWTHETYESEHGYLGDGVIVHSFDPSRPFEYFLCLWRLRTTSCVSGIGILPTQFLCVVGHVGEEGVIRRGGSKRKQR